jgi:uncharacterized membrane protein required for colicin V production
MDLTKIQVNWVDLAVVAVLFFGLTRGRKRGMSEELLDVFKWLIIVVAAGFFYAPIANAISANSVFSLLTCNITSYVLLALLVMVAFALLQRSVGQKLVGSDVFGAGEYYLGMMGGMVRYGCIAIVVFSLINARHYTPDEIRQTAKYQQDNFGDISFPTFGSIQEEVMRKSLIGRFATQYLDSVILRSTAPQEKGLMREGNIVKAREREVDQVLEKQ